jgi:hypothetical protein
MITERAQQNNFQKVRLANPENDTVEKEQENEDCNVSKSVAKDTASSLVLGSAIPSGGTTPKLLGMVIDLIQTG